MKLLWLSRVFKSQSSYNVFNIKAGSLGNNDSNQMQNEMVNQQPQQLKLENRMTTQILTYYILKTV